MPGKKAVGIKKVTCNEEFFNGHFPLRPIMPGVLQVEAMAQVGGMVCLQEPVTDGTGDFFFAGVNNVKWRRPVVPGDTLVMEMERRNAKFGLQAICEGGGTASPMSCPSTTASLRMIQRISD